MTSRRLRRGRSRVAHLSSLVSAVLVSAVLVSTAITALACPTLACPTLAGGGRVAAPLRAEAAARGPAVWRFVGHGTGDGDGMGQWGALGDAVRLHWRYQRILAHFYGGTRAGNIGSLGLGSDPWLSVLVTTNLDAAGVRGYDPVVTSSGTMTLASSAGAPPVAPTAAPSAALAVSAETGPGGRSLVVPPNTAVDLHLERDGTWSAFEGRSCGVARREAARGSPSATGLHDPVLLGVGGAVAGTAATAAATAGAGQGGASSAASGPPLRICRRGGTPESVPGAIEAVDHLGYERTLAVVQMQDYVAGVVAAEMPAAWATLGPVAPVGAQGLPAGFQALEAQAVAVRSYAVAYGRSGGWNGYATICDSVLCQVYAGSGVVSAVDVSAAQRTAGQVRLAGARAAGVTDSSGASAGSRAGSGASGGGATPSPDSGASVTATPYSASTGGWTSAGAFPAVPDRGDACLERGVSWACNPYHLWRVAVPTAALSRALGGLGRLLRLRVIERNGLGALGGRVLRLEVIGSAGHRTLSGLSFAAAAGLPSNWFAETRPPQSPAPPATAAT